MNEWLTTDNLVLDSLDKTSTLVFFSLGICFIPKILNLVSFSLANQTYCCSAVSFV